MDSVNSSQIKLLKTRFVLIALAVLLTVVASGLHQLIR